MVNKPRRRKQASRIRTYIMIGLILVLVVSSVSYAYVAGLGPFNRGCDTLTTSVPASSLLYARVNTSEGSFVVELFSSLTPKTVTNFVNLVNEGFYNNLTWHRIVPGFVIQTGDPSTRNGGGNRSTWGDDSSNVSVPFEYSPSLQNCAYSVAMASTGAGVGGTSQFYINLVNNLSLDKSYAVFGAVVSGQSVVKALGNVPVESVPIGGGQTQSEPAPPVFVTSITMVNGT